MTAGLCLARAICIWGNEIMPTFMTGWAQERLGPTVGLIAKDVKRSPVMVFGAIGAAHLTLVSWPSWFNFTRHNASSQDNLLGDEVRGAMPTVAHVEVLNRTALVFALNNLPRLIPAALGAWVVWPFKGFCNHETVSVLR